MSVHYGLTIVLSKKANCIVVEKYASNSLDLTLPKGCPAPAGVWKSISYSSGAAGVSIKHKGNQIWDKALPVKSRVGTGFDRWFKSNLAFDVLPKLLPHQQALRTLHKRSGDPIKTFLLFWRLGTGKTLGALSCFTERIDKPLIIVASNTLIHANWLKYVQSMPLETGTASITLLGYQEFTKLYCTVEGTDSLEGCSVIVDEIQRFRNATGNDKMNAELSTLCEAQELFCLTGSPMMGSVDDLCSLLCLVERKPLRDQLPSKKELRTILDGHLLYDCLSSEQAVRDGILDISEEYKCSKSRDEALRHIPWLPGVKLTQVPVVLSWLETYEYMTNISNDVCKKLHLYTPTTNRYHSAEKQRINGPKMEVTTRLMNELIERKNSPVLLSSLFIKNGIQPFIESAKPSWTKAVLDGATETVGRGKKHDPDSWTRTDIVEKLKKNEIDVLFLTSATGGEGLDLKNVLYLICLDIQTTEEAFRQLQGRIARFHGQKEPDAVVEVYQVMAEFPSGNPSSSELNAIHKLHVERTGDDSWTPKEVLEIIRDIMKTNLKNETVDQLLQRQNMERQKPIDTLKLTMLSWPEMHYYRFVSHKHCPSLKKRLKAMTIE